ncbi:MAG: lasso peptide biosynthesis B2 protein [Vicinamibacterales bacterium]|nr:lasso peptide biosynthesis B2 protein [Vicinamibacterales bacterium]
MDSLRRFLRRPPDERVAVVEASCALALARVALLLLPFRRLARWLGAESAGPPAGTTAQSLAATLMLRRRRLDAVTCLGVARAEDGRIRAHAWTRCGDLHVAGGVDVARYQVVATYISRSTRRP